MKVYQAELDKIVFGGSPPRPVPLWHYTSRAGFEGILTSGGLRATDYRAAQDPSDVSIGYDVIDRVAEALEREDGHPAFTWYRGNLARGMRITDGADVFRMCFCKSGRDASMWDRYADNGRGYVLGFDISGPVTDGFPTKNIGFSIVPLVYAPAEQERLVRSDFEGIVAAARRYETKYPSEGETATRLATTSMLRAAAAFTTYFKHDSYESEKEWRLSCIVMNEAMTVESYQRDGQTVRFVQFPPQGRGLFPLTEVVIGPKAARTFDVEARLRAHGFGSTKPMPRIVRSDVPMR